MKGYVRTEELNIKNVEAGVIAVLKHDSLLHTVTIQHINTEGSWVVMGKDLDDYTVPASAELCKLVIIDTCGVYPLKFNQWTNAIKNKEVNSDEPVDFELISHKFRNGKYMRTCSECTAQFIGGKSQPFCKTCCEKDVIAQIQINKKVKPKRPRIKSVTEIKALALTAYQMGENFGQRSDFNTWLEKQF